MNKVLIDSSVWIAYFRKKDLLLSEKVNSLLDEGKATLCGMVELEILQGLRDKEEQKLISSLFEALNFIDSTREDFIAAGILLNQLRKKGITMAPSDCLIGSICLRHPMLIYTLDNDFKHIPALKHY